MNEVQKKKADKQGKANHRRQTALGKRLCKLMGWTYKTCPVWTGLRKVALGEAVVIGLDKLELILEQLEKRA